MAIVAIPKTWVSFDALTAVDLNVINTVIYGEFNGNIDNTNIKAGANIDASKLLNSSIPTGKIADGAITEAKIDYTSVKVVRTGVVGIKMARGSKAITFAVGRITPNPETVTFSTDADDGNPAFSAAPRVVITVIATTGTSLYQAILRSVSASAFTFDVLSTSGADGSTQALHWVAVGV